MITEKRQNIGTILPILVLLLFTAAIAAHYALEPWGFYRKPRCHDDTGAGIRWI